MARNKPASQSPIASEPQVPFKGYVACSANPFCRNPGRLWLPGMDASQRVCVDHFATDERRHEIANWNLGVPNAK